jgi:hypothetical protein
MFLFLLFIAISLILSLRHSLSNSEIRAVVMFRIVQIIPIYFALIL